jgi:hypothetical protein
MEASPAVLPARFDLEDVRSGERGENALGRFAVGGELYCGWRLALLETAGSELDKPRTQLLRRLTRNADRGADQRNALFSFPKKPSSRR